MSRLFSAESQALFHASQSVTLFDESLPFVGVIALDEVGRGSLAGAVVTGASVWRREHAELPVSQKWVKNVDDSKVLTALARDKCYAEITNEFAFISQYNVDDAQEWSLKFCDLESSSHKPLPFNYDKKNKEHKQFSCIDIALGSATVAEIETHNIWGAVQLGFGRALEKLSVTLNAHGFLPEQFLILVDGKLGIKVPRHYANCRQLTAVGGDGQFVSIGCSSVVAKVVRDRYMTSLASQHTVYGFDGHKGYATAGHRQAIREHGASVFHRRHFLSNIL